MKLHLNSENIRNKLRQDVIASGVNNPTNSQMLNYFMSTVASGIREDITMKQWFMNDGDK